MSRIDAAIEGVELAQKETVLARHEWHYARADESDDDLSREIAAERRIRDVDAAWSAAIADLKAAVKGEGK